ncbi:ceramide synthase 6 [Procambarus clarkii]|uniref:ceramide synthase 6 n=1 Tax=Procambarus clarkii TaxID=6728 RepID=UPI001E6741ED|nr:ceramide synthase 6-like [Procambarus clarkii]XP_045597499.1 ceramide synthase 6-like [Procambarus clarkii]
MSWTGLSQWFWSEDVWLPPFYTWDDLVHSRHFIYPNFYDVWTYPLGFALFFIALRYLVLTPYVFTPIANFYGVKNTQARPPPFNTTLNGIFRQYRSHAPVEVVSKAAQSLGWTERQVERWLRQQALAARTTDLGKFCGLAWEALYYTLYCIMGLVVLWDKPWLWDIRHCWYGFPRHNLDTDVWWYYMVPLGFYWSMTITHSFQHRRKDSNQLFVHHVLTIMLISFSWACNFVRIGTLVLVVHECADIPMLVAKMCKLCGRRDLMDNLFVVFLLLWLSTRTGLYPLWILRSTLFEAHVILGLWYPVYYIFNGMLLLLMLIHLGWTFLILRIVVRKLRNNQIDDVRSSTDDSVQENDEAVIKKEN